MIANPLGRLTVANPLGRLTEDRRLTENLCKSVKSVGPSSKTEQVELPFKIRA